MSSAPVTAPGPSVPAVLARVARLREEAAGLAVEMGRLDWGLVDGGVAAQVAAELWQVGDRCSASGWAALTRAADSGWTAEQGYTSPAVWWQRETRLSRDEAGAQIRLARRIARHYARTGAAWAAGEVNADHGRVIAGGIDAILGRVARRVRRDLLEAGASSVEIAEAVRDEVAGAREVLETELLTLARTWGPEALRVALARARLLADPDGASEEQMRRDLQAQLRIEVVGEEAVLHARLSLELAEMLRLVLDHHRRLLHSRGATGGASPRDDGGDRSPDSDEGNSGGDPQVEIDPVTEDPVVRTNAQLDADAFAAWVSATLDAGVGSGPVSERPHLDVVVTVQELQSGIGAAVLARTDTPVPAAAARRVACDCDVRVVLVDGVYRDARTGEVLDPVVGALLSGAAGLLDYGRAHRIVPGRLRRALAYRDRGCAFPGCGRPPAHTEAHHIEHWLHGGETSLSNTVLLCSRHHHFVHEGGWQIALRPGRSTHQPGCWQFTPPRRRTRL